MFIFIFFVLFSLIVASDKSMASVKITDNNFTIEEYEMKMYDKYVQKDKPLDISLSAKIIYLSGFERYLEIVDKYEGYYNDRWVILVDKFSAMDDLTDFINKKLPHDINAIIIDISMSLETFYIQTIPIFIAQSTEDFISLQKYDIENETSNYFLRITYSNTTKVYPINYLMILSITVGIICLLTTIYWHIFTFRIYRNQVSTIQKILAALPYIKTILSPMLIYYINYANSSILDPTTILIVVYVDTIISALWAIYKTIFWFLAVLISSGWQIHKTELSRSEMRKFVGFYIFIYFFVCFDKIIDIMVGRIYLRFEISELKNFCLYTLISGYCIYQSIKSIRFIKDKFLYASILAPEYLPALALKIKMLFFFSFVTPLYTICYIAMIVSEKYVYYDYSGEIFTMVNNHALEVIFLLFELFIFRPRRFPRYFNIDYHIEEFAKTSIFNCKLPSLQNMANNNTTSTDFGFLNLNKKEKKKMVFDKNSPFIVVNPIFKEDARRGINYIVINRSDSIDSAVPINITDKISVGLLSQK